MKDEEGCCDLLRKAVHLRIKYAGPAGTPLSEHGDSQTSGVLSEHVFSLNRAFLGSYRFSDGVADIRDVNGKAIVRPFSLDEFYEDMDSLFRYRSSGPVMSFCHQRLRLLKTKFELYSMVYADNEREELCASSHRDFYNVRKVDTHVHHSAAMNAKYLLRFIKAKIEKFPEDVCYMEGAKGVTLREVFENVGVDPYELSLDKLNVLADKSTLHRFDRFNAKYSPFGEPLLRTVFLKTDNYMEGRYLGEITRQMLNDLEDSKFQHTEWRLSIYGRNVEEWDKLAKWVLSHNLLSPNNRWIIQIPRLYSMYRKNGDVKNFEELLNNIFRPLLEVTINPLSHPELDVFLKHVSAFDTVDDESLSPLPNDRFFSSRELTPPKWDLADNPSYKYYCFYIYSNIRVLNALRRLKDPLAERFAFRPHSGEAGEIHHLDTAFLLADRINHGINLRRSPSLQYLFYVCQIGLAVSPCSNNQLFLAYDKNPFGDLFEKGLNVSLSTDDPLMFHQTKEPLIEEYSIAKQVWRLGAADLCEIARNSVLQSGFKDDDRSHWLGSLDRWATHIERTNVPTVRVRFRHKTYLEEWSVLSGEASLDSLISFTTTQLLQAPRSGKSKGPVMMGTEGNIGSTKFALHRLPSSPLAIRKQTYEGQKFVAVVAFFVGVVLAIALGWLINNK
jgi:AMP deaminase